jgi:hypothetical protein
MRRSISVFSPRSGRRVDGMGRTVLLSVTMALALLLGCGGVAQAIINGKYDLSAHPYVGLAYNRDFGCSGALISPRVFLTSGYCTDQWEHSIKPNVRVTIERRTYFEPEFSVRGVPHTHPLRDRGPDVGVVVLDEPVRTEDGYAKLPEAGLVDDLPHRADLVTVGYDTKDLIACRLHEFCYWDRPSGVAKRYNATQEYVGDRDFDGLHSGEGKWIKTSQASAEQGREGTCFSSYGIPYFLASDQRTIVALDSYWTARRCSGTSMAERVDQRVTLQWVKTFL